MLWSVLLNFKNKININLVFKSKLTILFLQKLIFQNGFLVKSVKEISMSNIKYKKISQGIKFLKYLNSNKLLKQY